MSDCLSESSLSPILTTFDIVAWEKKRKQEELKNKQQRKRLQTKQNRKRNLRTPSESNSKRKKRKFVQFGKLCECGQQNLIKYRVKEIRGLMKKLTKLDHYEFICDGCDMMIDGLFLYRCYRPEIHNNDSFDLCEKCYDRF